MAVPSFKRRQLGFFTGLRETVQAISVSGAAAATPVATQIKPYGVTIITTTGTGGPHLIALPRPKGNGIRKTVLVKMNSSADVRVINASTSDVFFGSTVNAATFATTSLKGQGHLELISASTTQWALLSHRGTTAATQYPFSLSKSTA